MKILGPLEGVLAATLMAAVFETGGNFRGGAAEDDGLEVGLLDEPNAGLLDDLVLKKFSIL